MKLRTLTCVGATTLLTFPTFLAHLSAQEQQQEQRRYKLIDLGTFGGPASYINPVGNGGPYMNGEGAVVGSSQTSIPPHPNANTYPCPGPPVFHAMEWGDGGVTDLGSLPGAGNCSNALAINDAGDSVGTSENGTLDPLTGVVELRAVRWKDRQIKNLGTFGGNQSFATAINSRGQIVGFALNEIPDSYSLFDLPFLGSSNGTQTRAFLWQNGHMQDLDTLGGPDAWATFVNERGQVAGYSYTNSTPNPTTKVPTADPFLWSEHDGMIDLGTLGGTFGAPVGFNNRGQVIGGSNLAGDQNSHPFLWDGEKLIDMFTDGIGGNLVDAQAINNAGEVVGAAAFPNHPFDAATWRNGVVTDLGALPGDCFSWAFALNSRGQVVGNSFPCAGGSSHVFLWEKGHIIDLNTLIAPNSGFQLVETNAINDREEIAGNGFPPGCADFSCSHAYVLIPCDGDNADTQGCEANVEGSTALTQDNPAPINQTSTTVTQGSPAVMEMMARVHARLARRYPGLGPWPGK
jgi:probable HAF family extracellular repeat protein